ncbi:MAG: hypothetical protein HQ547_04045, partial [Candidatus Omnitrophica bacterium]|nr:hypothetical protein [Candidatus Omnitrophota bacterium]
MRILKEHLAQRQREGNIINVAIIGSGWFGSGLIRELYHWPGINPKLVITRSLKRAAESLSHVGIDAKDIITVKTTKEYKASLAKRNTYLISDNLELAKELKGIDAVFEATGAVGLCAELAKTVISQGIHFITANIEMDSTVGFAVDDLAKKHGVVYSISDGDQPGVLSRMIDEVQLYGFEITVAGNCKTFIDMHQ